MVRQPSRRSTAQFLRTLATRFWAYASELDFAAAAPYALLMVVLSLPLVVLLRMQADKASAP